MDRRCSQWALCPSVARIAQRWVCADADERLGYVGTDLGTPIVPAGVA